MTSPFQPPDAATFEQLIFQVRGIQAARVVTNQNGGIDEVHVVGLPGRSAKQIVRDIESILYVRGGVRLDHRKVSLVQLNDGLPQLSSLRVQLLEVAAEPGSPTPAITVTLTLGERQACGTSAGADPAASPTLLAAQATLSAVTRLVAPWATLQVEHVAEQRFGELPVCLCHVSLVQDGSVEALLGTSMVRDNPTRAAAHAALDAINRRLAGLLGDEA